MSAPAQAPREGPQAPALVISDSTDDDPVGLRTSPVPRLHLPSPLFSTEEYHRAPLVLLDESREDIEGYTLYDADISRCVIAPRNPSLSDAEECAEANSAAVFHAMRGPDDEGLPCMEIAGILVFAYLDADRGAVRISVHLDTTDEQLVRADGTVPLLVEIEDATVFDNLTPPPAPAEPTGWKKWIWRLTRRIAHHDGSMRRHGG
ncbi:hypothetical protein [Streptomyces sp. 4N124]|uniref:hypothetical protein n=1 Tax=Streptomyces sp. 4N124 TaxID=3457420 RepID=UPI003FCF2724